MNDLAQMDDGRNSVDYMAPIQKSISMRTQSDLPLLFKRRFKIKVFIKRILKKNNNNLSNETFQT